MAKANFTCPTCNSTVWDNRTDKRSERAPNWKCSNKSCTGGKNGQGWASWDTDVPKGVTVTQAAAPQSSGNGAAPPTYAQMRATVSVEEFVRHSVEMTALLMAGVKDVCVVNGLEVPHGTLLTEVLTTVRQGWIEFERGVLKIPGTEPAQPPPPPSAKDRYHTQINDCTDMMSVARLMAAIGGDAALDGVEKEELAEVANARLGTLKAADAV